jgi:hypothetical protein
MADASCGSPVAISKIKVSTQPETERDCRHHPFFVSTCFAFSSWISTHQDPGEREVVKILKSGEAQPAYAWS